MSSPRESFASARQAVRAGWLRPYYVEVARGAGFANLSPAHQFRALVEKVAEDQPDRAAELRESNAATARALIGWLAEASGEKAAARAVALWRVRKGRRELCCVAVNLPTGLNLRLMEGDDFRRTTWCADASMLTIGADDWLDRLTRRGWMKVETTSASL